MSTPTADRLAARVLTAYHRFTCMGRIVEDERLTRDLRQREKIEEGAARVVKTLMLEQTRPIMQLFGRARKRIRAMTFAGLGNSRIMSSACYPEFMRVCGSLSNDLERLVQEFVDAYPDHLRAEERKFGDSYCREDYPPDDQIATAFGFEYGAFPMARPSEAQIDALTAGAISEIQHNYEQQITAAVANIEQECMSRALALLADLSAELSKDRPALYDSENRRGIVPRLRDYITTLRQNNLSDNPTMQRLADEIDRRLILATDTLKSSRVVRVQTAEAARTIMDTFAGLGVRKLDVDAA